MDDPLIIIIIIIIIFFIETIRLTNRNRLQCTIMQLKQLTRTQMTEDINLSYKQNRQPAIHSANSSLQSMSALRGHRNCDNCTKYFRPTSTAFVAIGQAMSLNSYENSTTVRTYVTPVQFSTS